MTRTLFRVGDASYPTGSIGSVAIRYSNSRLWYVMAGVPAFLGVGSLLEGKEHAYILFGIAALLVAVGYNQKSSLNIRTASGDHTVLRSGDQGMLGRVKTAIEEAVTRRG